MSPLSAILLALVIDALLGDPGWLWDRFPHPAALMGRLVAWLEGRLNHGRDRRAKGVLALLVLILLTGLTAHAITLLPAGDLLATLAMGVLLAQKSLAQHVGAVAKALTSGGLSAGRRAVARIVGRDVETLDEAGVARAAIESAAENFSDGVVAPLFWGLLFGLPGMAIYKAVNTSDSMIGYRNARYRDFGWAAARLDDVLNWVPARLSGALICLAHLSARAWRVMLRDARLHRSPNAGWPEAALAGVLGVALSGPRVYDGRLVDEPFVNAQGRRDAGKDDIRQAVGAIWRSWAVMVLLLGALWLVVR